MQLKDLLPIIKNVAPAIATALGGPVAGVATKFLGDALMGDENAPEVDIAAALQSPDNLVKLRELNNTFQLKMAEAGIDLEKVHAADRASAREMAVKTTLKPQMIISTIFVLAFAVILYTVFTNTLEMNDIQKNITMYLLGILSAGMIQIMNFWFGSSSGSKEKDKLKI